MSPGVSMNRRITNALRQIDHAGNPEDRRRTVEAIVLRFLSEVEALKQEADAGATAFRRSLAAWWSQAVKDDQKPFAIVPDVHRWRLYAFAGSVTGCAEASLASWIFYHWQVPWWIGAITAVAVTVILHGAFHVLTYDEARPRRAIYLIQRYAIAPAAALFFVAFAVVALARYAYDPNFVLFLLPLLSIGLWLATLSLLVLSAGLFTIGHIFAWSERAAKDYWSVQRRLSEYQNVLTELRDRGSDTGSGPDTNLEVSHAESTEDHGAGNAHPELVPRVLKG